MTITLQPRGDKTDFWRQPLVISPNNFKYKALSNWACNTAVGCGHACRFCYVPSASTNKLAPKLEAYGVADPDAEWGDYVLVRQWDEKKFLASLRAAENTPVAELKPDGNRAIIFCSTTDAYQTIIHPDVARQKQLAEHARFIVRRSLELIRDNSTLNVRILTRSPLARQDFDLFQTFGNRLVFGMSIPTLREDLARIYEPRTSRPSQRLATLKAAKEAGLHVYVAIAPSYPECDEADLRATLRAIAELEPITIFHEPINIRAENVARIEAEAQEWGAQLNTAVFATADSWRKYELESLTTVEAIAKELGVYDRLHLWPDQSLGSKAAVAGQPDPAAYLAWLHHWWNRISEWPKESTPIPPSDPAGAGNGSADAPHERPVIHIARPAEPVSSPIAGTGESGEFNSPSSPNSPTPQAPAAPREGYYPEASLIGEIVHYLHGQIETPNPFVVAGTLTLVSVALNRNFYFVWGDKRHYPSLYQVLVGPSGVTRKSELTARIAAIIEELWPERTLADFTSVERLVESLAHQPIRAIIQSEGKMFIDKLNQSPNLANAIIKLYDCEDLSTDFKKDKKRRDKKKLSRKETNDDDGGRIAAKDTFLPILIGITSDALRLSEVNQAGGLVGRFQPLFADKREHEILDAPPANAKERQRLIDALRALGQLHGEMQLSPAAAHAFREVQRDNRQRMDSANDIVNSNLSRMPFTIIKVAMLYEVAMSGQHTISLEALQLAQNFVELGHRCYVRFFHEMAVKRQQDRLIDRIVRTLRRNERRLSHSELLRQTTRHGEWNAEEFKAALLVLADRGMVRFDPSPPAQFPDIILVAQDEGPDGSTGAPAPITAPTGTFDPAARYIAPEKRA